MNFKKKKNLKKRQEININNLAKNEEKDKAKIEAVAKIKDTFLILSHSYKLTHTSYILLHILDFPNGYDFFVSFVDYFFLKYSYCIIINCLF